MTDQHGAEMVVDGKDEGDKQARAAVQRIVLASLLAGLCPVIPIPFVDDMALRFVRKRALRAELARGGLRPGRAQLDVYLQEPSKVLGCLTAVLIYPLKKIFRKVFIVFAIKDCVDAASRTFHELWMVRHAVASGQMTAADLTVEVDALLPLRRAVEATAQQVDTRPINQMLRRAFSGSKSWVRQGGRALGKTIRLGGGTRSDPDAVERAVEGVGPSGIGEVDDMAGKLGEQMWAERGYLESVEKAFDKNWARRHEKG